MTRNFVSSDAKFYIVYFHILYKYIRGTRDDYHFNFKRRNAFCKVNSSEFRDICSSFISCVCYFMMSCGILITELDLYQMFYNNAVFLSHLTRLLYCILY